MTSAALARTAPFLEPELGGYTLALPDTETVAGDGWLDIASVPPHVAEHLLQRGRIAANTSIDAVPATWIVEKAAWFLAAATLTQLLQVERFVTPSDMRLLHGDSGWAEAVATPPARHATHDRMQLAHRLELTLAPLVDAFVPHRSRRALWLSVSDRVAQAALFVGPALDRSVDAIEIVTDALALPTALRAPARFTWTDGVPQRRRVGCCLSYRCPDGGRCADCPVQA